MILYCAACGSQNFVSAERRAVVEIPPKCWNCGHALALTETPRETRESNKRKGHADPKEDD